MPTRARSLRSVPVSKNLGDKRLRSLYSVPVVAPLPSREVGEFRVWRGYEGLQIVINWPTLEFGSTQIKIMRKLYDWPSSVTDGVCLVTDSYPFSVFSFSDRDLQAYQVYYYALFVRRLDGVWYTDKTIRGKTFPLPTAYFEDALWNRLPPVYHRSDGEN